MKPLANFHFQQSLPTENHILKGLLAQMAKPKVKFNDEVEGIEPATSSMSTEGSTVLVYNDVRLRMDDGKTR